MAIEGELIVRLCCDGRRVRQATVRSTRPALAARVLIGRTPTDAAAMVPRLFGICSGAQGAAAAAALAAAGAEGNGFAAANRDREVMLEALQDTFWHVLIDWPNIAGTLPPSTTPVAAARFAIASAMRAQDGTLRVDDVAAQRELGARLSSIAAQAIFGMPPGAWLALDDVAALGAWAERGGTSPATLLRPLLADVAARADDTTPLLPLLDTDALRETLVPALRTDPAFALAPTWAGAPAETGGLARMRDEPMVAALIERYGPAVVSRIVARLAELARQLQALEADGDVPATPPRVRHIALDDGEGLAAVETARGLLVHRAVIAEARVAAYQIVAPTEWNFHPDGALVRGLAGLEAADEFALLTAARLAVHALDPCVSFRVEADHA